MDQVSDLPAKLSKPAKRAFAQVGYSKLEQFAGLTESEVLALHGVGPTASALLRQALAEKGLAFRK